MDYIQTVYRVGLLGLVPALVFVSAWYFISDKWAASSKPKMALIFNVAMMVFIAPFASNVLDSLLHKGSVSLYLALFPLGFLVLAVVAYVSRERFLFPLVATIGARFKSWHPVKKSLVEVLLAGGFFGALFFYIQLFL